MDFARRFLVVLLCSFFLGASAQTQSEEPIGNLLPGAKRVGQGDLSFLGYVIYQAQLWAQGGYYEPNRPFLLVLSYQRDISRQQIVTASFEQMLKLGIVLKDRSQWERQLFDAFRDVKSGDMLAGVFYPDKGASFYFNNAHTADLSPALARALADIWLDPKTSEPALRQALLGGRP